MSVKIPNAAINSPPRTPTPSIIINDRSMINNNKITYPRKPKPIIKQSKPNIFSRNYNTENETDGDGDTPGPAASRASDGDCDDKDEISSISSSGDPEGVSDSSNFEELIYSEIPLKSSVKKVRKSSKVPLEVVMYNPAQLLEKNQESVKTPKEFVPVGALNTPETKRQDYHLYLQKSGLLGAISKSILALYECEDLPSVDDASEFVANILGFSKHRKEELDELRAYNENLRDRIERLDATNDLLRRTLDMYESTETEVEQMDPDEYQPKLNPSFPPPKVQLNRRTHRNKPPKLTKPMFQSLIFKTNQYNESKSNMTSRIHLVPQFDYPVVWRDEKFCEIYHGVKIKDPYRWLEEQNSVRVRDFVQNQNETTLKFLELCPKRSLIKTRLTELLNYERFSSPFKVGEKYYYFKNSGLQNQSVMYVQESLLGVAKVFFDPNKLSQDGTVAIADYKFSENGEIFAYGLSQSGSDWITMYFKNSHTGENYPEKLERVKFTNINWTHDNLGVFYACYPVQPGKMDGSETTRALDQKIYYHRIGTPQVDDVLVIEFPDHPTWHLDAQITDCGKYIIINVSEEISKECLYYVNIEEEVQNGIQNKFSALPIVTHFDAKYNYITNTDSEFYFLTSLNAPNNRVVSVDIENLENLEETIWRNVVPENPEYALDWVKCVEGDKLVACYIEDVKNTLTLYKLKSGSFIQNFPLEVGTVTEFSGTTKSSEIFFQFSSFLTRGRIYYADLSEQDAELSIYQESAMEDVDIDNFVTSQVFYPSKDGTNVPMFIMHNKGLELNGDNLCLLYGYGGFGFSIMPGFYSMFMFIMQNMNGVIAVANIRGGGEYGESWHKGGILNNKQKSFDDFQSAAEYLIKMKYTQSSKLIIKGRSNGGLLVGACINQRPDLFGAAIAQVGVMDLLRFDKFTIGHAWCSDYGKPSHEPDFKNLLGISPLHNVNAPEEEGVQYPAVLLFTADHDDRVVPLHSYKFIAELQHRIGKLPSQTNPLMIRVDTKAGHGSHMPISKWIEEETDILSFVIQALGGNFTQLPSSSQTQ